MSPTAEIKKTLSISTLLLIIMLLIAIFVLSGLVIMTHWLVEMQSNLNLLRDSSLPRLVKLSQLSHEAAATISIAPALSARPTRFEFETLLSRIKDKEASQKVLLKELAALYQDKNVMRLAQSNGDLLNANLLALTTLVRQQINIRKQIENYIESFGAFAWGISSGGEQFDSSKKNWTPPLVKTAVLNTLITLFDPNSGRFPLNKKKTDEIFIRLSRDIEPVKFGKPSTISQTAMELVTYWNKEQQRVYEIKKTELTNDFKIKALTEENSLITNRLLYTANNEFKNAGSELEKHIKHVDSINKFALMLIIVIIITFGTGIFLIWLVLTKRVFRRLNRICAVIQSFADQGNRGNADPIMDEIGKISGSLIHYMTVIEKRETELQLLSSKLAKYLSPQVYNSIFIGKQDVKVAGKRKKLTVFFSDIVGFTEATDRMQYEELTWLLNHYLTEMSKIALQFGATIDKYVGDAILIFFGDPESRGVRHDALACVKMALVMRKRMAALQNIWRDSGFERPLKVRMGIHTGYCMVGNFGSEDRMDYTIIGGTVNTASRLESQADPDDILISYETMTLVKEEILCIEHGQAKVKGIHYPITTFKVVDLHENLEKKPQQYKVEHHGITLDIDLDVMMADDRNKAKDVLHKALVMLGGQDKSTLAK